MKYRKNVQIAREKYLKTQFLSQKEQELIDKDFHGEDYKYFKSVKRPFLFPDKYSADETYKIIGKKLSNDRQTRDFTSGYMKYAKYVAALIVIAAISTFVYKYISSPADIISVSTSYGERKEVSLPDGSVVILNSLSKLSYPEKMNGNVREVKLQGEGYFDVAKNPEKTFVVKVNNLNIKVLGTKFNVEAYENQESITTSLFEGIVSVNLDNGYTKQLEPGQQAVFEKKENKFDIVQSAGIDGKIDWHKGIFTFNSEPLENILNTLTREYNTNFNITDQELKKLRVTIRFDAKENRSVENILSLLGESANFSFQKQGNIYLITYK
jgi:ferric-dicitrate binding protein FerR (iron transport regulator)